MDEVLVLLQLIAAARTQRDNTAFFDNLNDEIKEETKLRKAETK